MVIASLAGLRRDNRAATPVGFRPHVAPRVISAIMQKIPPKDNRQDAHNLF
jgi:hypothetical protein